MVTGARRPSAGLVLLAVICVWASTFAVTKDLVARAPPLQYLAIRFGIATVLVLPLLVLRVQRGHARSPGLGRDVLLLGLLHAVALALQVVGQVYTTASKSAFITSLNTPLVALVGLAVHRTLPSPSQRVAIVIASAGLLLLTWPPAGTVLNPGDLLTVGCAVFDALFITEAARRALRHDAMILAIGQIVVAAGLCALLLAATTLLRTHLPASDWPAIVRLEQRPFPCTPHVLLQVAYMSIVCVVLVMLAQTWALQRLSAATAAVIYAAEPVVATIIAISVYGASEWPGVRGVAGGVLVLAAAYVAERRASATTSGKKYG